MFTKVIVRFLKKRIVLAVIFCVSLLYCLSSLINEGTFGNETSDSIKRISLPPSSFKWHEEKDKNSSATISCRNSVQGKVLVADDRGKPSGNCLCDGALEFELRETAQRRLLSCQWT
uniref:Uncharacterized protein n=1 Tax=Ixodes ricinus TaxID=34613 RepID=A0A0K8RK38_IXORI